MESKQMMTTVREEEGREPRVAAVGPTGSPVGSSDFSSLTDLIVVLLKWRSVAAAVFGSMLAVTVAVALLLPPHFAYTTTIEVGKMFAEGVANIEPIETVEAKLKNAYIPLALKQFGESHPDSGARIDLVANVPRNSKVVVLSSSGPIEHAELHLSVHQAALDSLIADHHLTVEMLRSELENQLEQARIKLEFLRDPSSREKRERELETQLREAEIQLAEASDPDFLTARVKEVENRIQDAEIALEEYKDEATLSSSRLERLGQQAELLRARIESLRVEVAGALGRRERASENLDDTANAMTLLMIDNEIQQNRMLLASLEQELLLDLQDRREQLENLLRQNQARQEAQKDKIATERARLSRLLAESKLEEKKQLSRIGQLGSKLANLSSQITQEIAQQEAEVRKLEEQYDYSRDTRPLTPPLASAQPVARTTREFLFIGVSIALMVAVLSAFSCEYASHVRRRMALVDGKA